MNTSGHEHIKNISWSWAKWFSQGNKTHQPHREKGQLQESVLGVPSICSLCYIINIRKNSKCGALTYGMVFRKQNVNALRLIWKLECIITWIWTLQRNESPDATKEWSRMWTGRSMCFFLQLLFLYSTSKANSLFSDWKNSLLGWGKGQRLFTFQQSILLKSLSHFCHQDGSVWTHHSQE